MQIHKNFKQASTEVLVKLKLKIVYDVSKISFIKNKMLISCKDKIVKRIENFDQPVGVRYGELYFCSLNILADFSFDRFYF